MTATVATAVGCVTGALACQKDSYLRTLETSVVSCEEAKLPSAKDTDKEESLERTWQIEFADSVLFPEGGGQPSDHGSITVLPSSTYTGAILVTQIERQGLRCIVHSPQPLSVGDKVLQTVDFERRWHHMQQHTGQHLLSAVSRNLHDLKTVGWGMGLNGAMNYIDVQRKPTQDEMKSIQDKCNALIRDNLPIAVKSPEDSQDSSSEKGVVRVVSIGGLDENQCCGTHLSHTSHISMILLQSSQPVNSQRHRLFFLAGDRAIDHATSATQSLVTLGKRFSCDNSVDEVLRNAERLQRSITEFKKTEKKLITHIAKLESDRARPALVAGSSVCIYQADYGVDFLSGIKTELRDILANITGALTLVTGEAEKPGHVWIFGNEKTVEALGSEAKNIISELKGHGRGRTWQGKVARWGRHELDALQKLANAAI